MKLSKYIWIISIVITVLIMFYILYLATITHKGIKDEIYVREFEIFLPYPKVISNMSVEEAILYRRSIRSYTDEPLTILELSMILWSAQGITNTQYRFRAAPSAGATYPLEIYVVVGEKRVLIREDTFLDAGVYKYNVYRHSLVLVKPGDYREELSNAALGQEWVKNAAIDIVICAVYERTTDRYGKRGIRYVHMEVGHVGQNIYLMATALNLGTVAVGAFHDERVAEIIGAMDNEHPLYIMPVGRPVKPYRISFNEIKGFYEGNR